MGADWFLQGLVTGVAVVVGVVMAEWLVRMRERRAAVVRATLELRNVLPAFTGQIFQQQAFVKTGSKQDLANWWSYYGHDALGNISRAKSLLDEIRAETRRPMRRRQRILDEARLTEELLAAASIRMMEDKSLANEEVLLVASQSGKLAKAVVPEQASVEKRADEWAENGLPVEWLEDS